MQRLSAWSKTFHRACTAPVRLQRERFSAFFLSDLRSSPLPYRERRRPGGRWGPPGVLCSTDADTVATY